MNIFKILANGDGRINEANISAFLGYLLDPYQDHGLGFEFLERFLERVFEKQDERFNPRSYDYEIIFEQAFRDEDKEIKKKEIVDIVILCFNNNSGNYKELITETSISSKREVKYIFLLENKVTRGAKTNDQLKAQFENTIKKLSIDKRKVFSLYVTPDEKVYQDEFNKFVENSLKEHYVWKSNDEKNKTDIFNLLLELIEDESLGKIEAINEYTKHTLISFIKFIENDFKSQVVEKKENAEGKFKRDISNSLEEYFEKYAENLNSFSNQIVEEFTKYVHQRNSELFVRHTKTHPVAVLQNSNSGKIFGCSKNGKNLEYHFLVGNSKNPEIRNDLIAYLKIKKLNFTEADTIIIVRENLDIETVEELFDNFHEMFFRAGQTSNTAHNNRFGVMTAEGTQQQH